MAHTLRPVAALLFSIAFLLMGNGLQTTLVPIRADFEHFDALTLGLLGSSYYIGFVIGCLGGPYLILRAGHIRAFLAMVSLASAVALIHPLVVNEFAWFVFRAITGFCLAGLYLVIESWLNERADNENRGFVMSAYIVVNFTVITIGQMLVTLYPPREFALFALASVLVSLAALPIAMTRSEQPAPIAIVRFRPRVLFKTSPVGFVGVFLVGIANGAFWMLGAVYATQSGYSVAAAATFMSVAVIGGALMQWPVGRISDRVDRRLVLAGTLILAALAGLAIAFSGLGGLPFFVLAFLFGAFTLTGYAVAAAHAYDMADSAQFVEMAAGLLLANGIGSIVGPALAALAMREIGPPGLFVTIATSQFVLLVYVVYRMTQREALAGEEKTDYEFASAAPLGGVITPEPLEQEDPHVVLPELPDEPLDIGWLEVPEETAAEPDDHPDRDDDKE